MLSIHKDYNDDTTIVPRATSVIARRLPASRPGHGRAARYVSGKKPVAAKNAYRTESKHTKLAGHDNRIARNSLMEMDQAKTEEERITAMFKAGADQWEQQQQQMAG